MLFLISALCIVINALVQFNELDTHFLFQIQSSLSEMAMINFEFTVFGTTPIQAGTYLELQFPSSYIFAYSKQLPCSNV